MQVVEEQVLERISFHVDRIKKTWNVNTPPDGYFDQFKNFIRLFIEAIESWADHSDAMALAEDQICEAISEMQETYEPPSPTSAPTGTSTPMVTPLTNLFRDVDE